MSTTPFGKLIEQAAEAKYTVVPAGLYNVICTEASATKSSTGKDMIKLRVKVVTGPHKNATILTQQTLTPDNPAAVAMFLKFLDAFGLDEEFLRALPPREDGGPNFAAVASALKGRAAVAEVDVHQWNDEDRNGVKKFRRPTPEEKAAIEQTLDPAGSSEAFGAPKVATDPFASAPAGGGSAADPF